MKVIYIYKYIYMYIHVGGLVQGSYPRNIITFKTYIIDHKMPGPHGELLGSSGLQCLCGGGSSSDCCRWPFR